MKRFLPWMVAPLLAAGGCDSDNKEGDTSRPTDTGDATSPPDTSRPDATSPTDANTGVDTNIPTEPVTPNPACNADEVDHNTYGTTFPWTGLTAGGKSYTCNACPGGLADFQGAYRAHGYGSDQITPDYTKGADANTGDAELLIINGNTWYSRLFDIQTGTTQETRGWFFCSQQPENPNKHMFWVVTDVLDNGGSSTLVPGFVMRTDVILSQGGADRKFIFWFDDLTGPKNVQMGYCKVGTTFNGTACNDPFQ